MFKFQSIIGDHAFSPKYQIYEPVQLELWLNRNEKYLLNSSKP